MIRSKNSRSDKIDTSNMCEGCEYYVPKIFRKRWNLPIKMWARGCCMRTSKEVYKQRTEKCDYHKPRGEDLWELVKRLAKSQGI